MKPIKKVYSKRRTVKSPAKRPPPIQETIVKTTAEIPSDGELIDVVNSSPEASSSKPIIKTVVIGDDDDYTDDEDEIVDVSDFNTTNPELFECPTCQTMIPVRKKHWHMKRHQKVKGHNITCKVCGAFFANKVGARIHWARQHRVVDQMNGDFWVSTEPVGKDLQYPCRMGCGDHVVFPISISRRLHYMCVHRITDHKELDLLDRGLSIGDQDTLTVAETEQFCWLRWCTLCGLHTPTLADQENHRKTGYCIRINGLSSNTRHTTWWCQFCPPELNQSFIYRVNRRQHYRNDHKIITRHLHLLERVCSICSFVSRTEFGLQDHMTAHQPENCPLECELGCVHNYFRINSALYEHYTVVHPRVAASEYANHRCPVCLRTFVFQATMRRHGEQHRFDGRPFKCTMGCRQSNFVTQQGLDMHYFRDHCKQKVGVLRSRVIHRCTVCDEHFDGIENLSEHMRCHNPSYCYQCQKCTRTYFSTQEELKEHTSTKHGDEVDAVEEEQIVVAKSSKILKKVSPKVEKKLVKVKQEKVAKSGAKKRKSK